MKQESWRVGLDKNLFAHISTDVIADSVTGVDASLSRYELSLPYTTSSRVQTFDDNALHGFRSPGRGVMAHAA